MDAIYTSINEYWQLIQTHGIVNFALFLISLYFVPFAFKTVWWMIKNLLGPIFRVLFNDLIENKIKHFISAKLSKLTGLDVQTKDIPHLESDYLCLYKIAMSNADRFTVEFSTIILRIRFWRFVAKIVWNKLWHFTNQEKAEQELKNILSTEIKEIRLEEPTFILNTVHAEEHCPECASTNDIAAEHNHAAGSILAELHKALQDYNLHFIINRGAFKVNIRNTFYSVENVGGYIHNDKNHFQLYFIGLYDGQIISFANEDTEGYRYHLVVPGCTLTPALWEIISDNIPSLQCIKPIDADAIGRITDLHCRFSIENALDLLSLDWQIRDGQGEYNHKGSHSYRFTTGEGSFHIEGLKNFTVSKFNLKVNNHAVGWSGKFIFDKPLNNKENLKTNSSSFMLALDSTAFNFANRLNLAILDKFCLSGNLSMVDGAITLNFDSEQDNSTNALTLNYKKLKLVVDRFYGEINFSRNSVYSQTLGCQLISVGVGEESETDTQAKIVLRNSRLDLLSQDFELHANVKNMDVPIYYKAIEIYGQLNGTMDIQGNLAKPHSSTCIGEYTIENITSDNRLVDFMTPHTISGKLKFDSKGITVDALLNDKLKIPCRLINGKLAFEPPAIVKVVGEKLSETKAGITEKVAQLKESVIKHIAPKKEADSNLLPPPEAPIKTKEVSTEIQEDKPSFFDKLKSFFGFKK